jgi:hypothetical protein
MTANVTVFMPPPVPPGEAPINISIIKRKRLTGLRFEVGKVSNPAVRGVIDVNNEFHILSFNDKPLRVLSASKAKIAIVPVIISSAVSKKTIFA